MLKSQARTSLIGLMVLFLMLAPQTGWAQGQAIRLWAEGRNITLSDAQGGAGADTPFAVASIGKMFTAVAVLRVAERKGLSLEAPVASNLPPQVVADMGGLAGITLSHLLTMTSGLSDYYTDDFLEAALADPDRNQTALAALRAAVEDPPLFAPGDDFDYSNTNYLLLGILLEHLTAQPLARVLQTEVFDPAEMHSTFLAGSRPLPDDFARGHDDRALVRGYYAGTGFGDGGCLSTAQDLIRFMQALADGRLLATRPFAQMQHDPLGAGYGMGLEVAGAVIGHSGGDLGYASDLRMNLRTGRIAVELVASEDAGTDWAQELVED